MIGTNLWFWAATLPADRWDAFLAGDASAREEAVNRAARAGLVEIRASEVGVHPDPFASRNAQSAWARQAEGWAATLGFAPGLGVEAVREAALEALGRRGQLADLARRDVHEARPLLEHPSSIPGPR